MTGFDISGGRSHPMFEGIVICEVIIFLGMSRVGQNHLYNKYIQCMYSIFCREITKCTAYTVYVYGFGQP